MGVTAGNYQAKIESCGIGEIKSTGSIFAAVNFQVFGTEIQGLRLQWRGFLTPKAQVWTLEALKKMGLENDNLSLIADGKGLTSENVEVNIENETGSDGKEYAVIKWINGSEKKVGMSLLDSAASKEKLKALGFISGFTREDIPF
jgi:hypothetical protein